MKAGEARVKHKGLYLFAVLFISLCLLPLVGMLWMPDTPSSDDDSRSPLPRWQAEDGSFSLAFFQDLGNYFEDHFAFRNIAIDLDAHLRAGMLQTSPTSQVIVGRDGWLFYGGTLDDYRGTKPLSAREIVNISHNLSLMQGYTNAMGAEFVLAIAPNKNSLYPTYMPYYYLRGDNPSMQLLADSLDSAGVNYVDLFALFDSVDDELYYRTDTHWTSAGALLVTNALLDAGGIVPALPGEPLPGSINGDIERMLYPVSAGVEESPLLSTGSWSYSGAWDYSGSSNSLAAVSLAAASVEDDVLTTTSDAGTGSLLMYRDSFANTLIPLLAPQFAEAEFTKMIPYNLTLIAQLKPDVVIIERAERHIGLFMESPPYMYAPSTAVQVGTTLAGESYVDWHLDGDFLVIEGYVDDACIDTNDQIYVSLAGTDAAAVSFVPFFINYEAPSSSGSTSSYGFRLFLDAGSLTNSTYTIRILVAPASAGIADIVAVATLQL